MRPLGPPFDRHPGSVTNLADELKVNVRKGKKIEKDRPAQTAMTLQGHRDPAVLEHAILNEERLDRVWIMGIPCGNETGRNIGLGGRMTV